MVLRHTTLDITTLINYSPTHLFTVVQTYPGQNHRLWAPAVPAQIHVVSEVLIRLKTAWVVPARKIYLAHSGRSALNSYSVANGKYHRHLNVLPTPGE